MKKRLMGLTVLLLLVSLARVQPAAAGDAVTADSLVKGMFDYLRGKTSESTVTMLVHRPDWQRKVTIKAWTLGTEDSLFFITDPPKDQGNGTLKKGSQMWMYNPKVNRTIKIPPSMMAQSWMGSDFSNNDLAKTDTILNDYVHTITGTKNVDGKKAYEIKSMPKPQAPVVWGMQTILVREDLILLRNEFFDQDLKSVKVLECSEIKLIGGREYPTVWTMRESGNQEKYTILDYQKLAFDVPIKDNLFTLSSLSNPMRLR